MDEIYINNDAIRTPEDSIGETIEYLESSETIEYLDCSSNDTTSDSSDNNIPFDLESTWAPWTETHTSTSLGGTDYGDYTQYIKLDLQPLFKSRWVDFEETWDLHIDVLQEN